MTKADGAYPYIAFDAARVETWRERWEREFAPLWRQVGTGYFPREVPVPPVLAYGPRALPESNESVRTLRALEEQVRDHVPLKEGTP